ncbi:DUF3262 family protein (plasmid) [Microbulbifer sp. TRSA002]|uniref:DUF3262 family protein n=1 Tax=Microbulbifer sp. TRSA002 TaxID=3243382 RepID=UPI004039515B
MKPAQAAAFQEGTGNVFTAADLLWTIQAIGSTAVFLYVSWMCYRAYEDYGSGAIAAKDMVIVWLRSVFVMMVLLYLIVK